MMPPLFHLTLPHGTALVADAPPRVTEGQVLGTVVTDTIAGRVVVGYIVAPAGGRVAWSEYDEYQTRWVDRRLQAGQLDANSDGYINGIDRDLFGEWFDMGNPLADFNGDEFVNGIDFDEFVEAFENGGIR